MVSKRTKLGISYRIELDLTKVEIILNGMEIELGRHKLIKDKMSAGVW